MATQPVLLEHELALYRVFGFLRLASCQRPAAHPGFYVCSEGLWLARATATKGEEEYEGGKREEGRACGDILCCTSAVIRGEGRGRGGEGGGGRGRRKRRQHK